MSPTFCIWIYTNERYLIPVFWITRSEKTVHYTLMHFCVEICIKLWVCIFTFKIYPYKWLDEMTIPFLLGRTLLFVFRSCWRVISRLVDDLEGKYLLEAWSARVFCVSRWPEYIISRHGKTSRKTKLLCVFGEKQLANTLCGSIN